MTLLILCFQSDFDNIGSYYRNGTIYMRIATALAERVHGYGPGTLKPSHRRGPAGFSERQHELLMATLQTYL